MSEFKSRLISALEKLIEGTGSTIETYQITKPNNITRTAVCIHHPDTKLGINYYLDDLERQYESGHSIEEISADIVCHSKNDTTYKNSSILTSIIKNISSYETVKPYIIVRLLNLKENNKYLSDKIYYPYVKNEKSYELAICPCIRIPANDDSIGTIAVTKQLRSQWNVSDDELLHNAIECTKNTYGYRFQNIFDVISNLISIKDSFSEYMNPPEPSMYVFSNNMSCNGAATMLFTDELKNFSEYLGYNLYIIPSSIHETIIIPDDGTINPSSIQEMIRTVNENEVDPSDILSNQLFYYSRAENTITIVQNTLKED